jgi:negative regulator of genetic competence, sporulation and motility
MDGCKFFKAYSQSLEDSILYFYNNRYYLYFEIVSTRQYADTLLRSILEYGERSPLNRCILDEFGQCITPSGAVEKVLAAM